MKDNKNTIIPTKEEIYNVLCKRHGKNIQDKLAAAKVAIAGLGGLGSNIAVQLTRVGVGHLHLIDFDKVDLSNLNRQHYFLKHLGQYKTDALKSELLQINPYLDIKTDCLKVTPDKVKDLFKNEDIICEAFDVPENKAMLVNSVLEIYPEKQLLSGNGMEGFGNRNKIHTRKIMSNFHICCDEVTGSAPEKGIGLMAPRVAICASHEANMVLELILSK